MKIRKFVLPLLLLCGCTIVWGYNQLCQTIYERTDCEQFNIDHIELRTGIDIPSVSNSVCAFHELEQKKISSFTLAGVDPDQYAAANGFELTAGKFLKSGSGESYRWDARLDPATDILTVEIAYRR